MAVITISRELGSTGDWFDDKCYLADRLIAGTGYHYADKHFLSKVFREYGVTQFEREFTQTLGFWGQFDAQRGEERAIIEDLLNKATHALASHGNVILVGRGNFAMLQGLTDVLNVRIQASLPTRTAAVMKRFKLTDQASADEIVRKNDLLRESFIEAFYRVRGDWTDGFDLVINTTKFGPKLAVEMILAGVKHMSTHHLQGPDCKSLPVDNIMLNTVKSLLDCQTPHRNGL